MVFSEHSRESAHPSPASRREGRRRWIGCCAAFVCLGSVWVAGTVHAGKQKSIRVTTTLTTLSSIAEAIGGFGPNPVPIKTAMAVQGLMAEEFRPPLYPLEKTDRQVIVDVLQKSELFQSEFV